MKRKRIDRIVSADVNCSSVGTKYPKSNSGDGNILQRKIKYPTRFVIAETQFYVLFLDFRNLC